MALAKKSVKKTANAKAHAKNAAHVRQTCTTHAKSSRSGVLHSSSPYIVRQSDFDMI
jgi:hypothetical protein